MPPAPEPEVVITKEFIRDTLRRLFPGAQLIQVPRIGGWDCRVHIWHFIIEGALITEALMPTETAGRVRLTLKLHIKNPGVQADPAMRSGHKLKEKLTNSPKAVERFLESVKEDLEGVEAALNMAFNRPRADEREANIFEDLEP